MNLQMLQQLLTDPSLRLQVSRLLSNKMRADVKSLESSTQLSRRIAEMSRSGADGDAARALHGVVKEHLDFYETLVNMTLSFNQQLIDRLGDLGRDGGDQSGPSQGTMNLSAPLHATVRAPFHLENNKRSPISVAFEITPFVSEDGSHLVKPEAAFDPPSMMLRPAQEAQVQLVLPVADGFRPQTIYFATVTVTGLPATQMLVRLSVMAAQAEAAAPPSPTATPRRKPESSETVASVSPEKLPSVGAPEDLDPEPAVAQANRRADPPKRTARKPRTKRKKQKS
jgi:hypothetical protein